MQAEGSTELVYKAILWLSIIIVVAFVLFTVIHKIRFNKTNKMKLQKKDFLAKEGERRQTEYTGQK
ncbi:MAG: hypothetical protein K9I69_07545 [Ignavibacteriales bacterium]|nr:hypothetical protein [Ignavibacteriales bacterium]MCF8315039.1 hypothetical protein [Ignavibacteriales bacterium]MCF8435965.1 hypothetical protein [Ignavibacteriales bacterium]